MALDSHRAVIVLVVLLFVYGLAAQATKGLFTNDPRADWGAALLTELFPDHYQEELCVQFERDSLDRVDFVAKVERSLADVERPPADWFMNADSVARAFDPDAGSVVVSYRYFDEFLGEACVYWSSWEDD